jgi:MarR family transcriptional regulator, lower aerobic nicotinate degradation pathway regulator
VRYTYYEMTATPTLDTPSRSMQRVAKELAASSGFLLARLGLGFKTRAIARVEQAGYELYDYSVLAILAEGTCETQTTIADALGLDPSRLVALLDVLEKRGLVARQRDPQDRRRHMVSITPTGERELAGLREMVNRLEDEFLAPLDAKSRKTLHELLVRLAAQNDPRCAFAATGQQAPGR